MKIFTSLRENQYHVVVWFHGIMTVHRSPILENAVYFACNNAYWDYMDARNLKAQWRIK